MIYLWRGKREEGERGHGERTIASEEIGVQLFCCKRLSHIEHSAKVLPTVWRC
jgi:hypothetical protein